MTIDPHIARQIVTKAIARGWIWFTPQKPGDPYREQRNAKKRECMRALKERRRAEGGLP